MKKHFKNYFYSNVATRALGIITVPITTHFITPSDYGMVSLFSVYTGILMVLYTCNFHTSISRYYYENNKDFDSFVSFSFFASIVSTVLLGSLSLIYLYVFKPQTILPTWVFLVLILNTIFNIASSVFIQIHEPANNSGLIAKRTIITGISQFLLTILVTIFAPNPKWVYLIFTQLIGSVIINIYFFKFIKPYLKLSFNIRHLVYISRYSIPLIPYTLSGVLLSQIDRVMIAKSNNINDTGLYSFAMTIAMVIPLIGDSINRAFTPIYFKYINEKNYEQHDIDCHKYIKYWSFFATTFILTFFEPATFLLGERYKPSLDLVPIIIVGFMFEFLFNFFARNIGYAKKTILLSFILLCSGLINIILNFYTLKNFGYKIAALNTVISYFTLFIMSWIISKYILKLHTLDLKYILPSFFIVLFSSLFFYLTSWLDLNPFIYVLLKILFLAILIISFFREIIKSRLNEFFNTPLGLKIKSKYEFFR